MKLKSDINSSKIVRIFNLFGFIVVFIGFIISIKMNLTNRSLWLDEAFLAESISTRTLFNLIKSPLANDQAAPVLYLYAVKILTILFGNTEFVLRLYSVITFLLTIFFTYYVAKHLFYIKFAFLPVAFIANCEFMLKYSNQFKQYMSECVWVLLALIIYDYYIKNVERKVAVFIITTFFMFSIWAANPVCFVIGGIILYEVVTTFLQKDWKRMFQSFIICIGVFVSFVTNYIFWLKDANSDYMQAFWKDYAIILIPFSIKDIIHDIILLRGVAGILSDIHIFNALLCFLLVAAVITLFFVKRNRYGIIIILSMCLTLFASSIHMFPMTARLWTFSIPLIILIIFYSVNTIIETFFSKIDVYNIILGSIMTLLIFTNTGIIKYSNAENVYWVGEETNDLIAYVQENVTNNEKVFVYTSSCAVVKYKIGYDTNRIGNVDFDNIIWSSGTAEIKSNLKLDYDRIVKAKNCWIILSHVFENRWNPLYEKLCKVGEFELILDSHGTPLYYYHIY